MPKINNVTNKKIMEKLLKIEKEIKDFSLIKKQIDKIILDSDSDSDTDSESESESDTDSESESESDTDSDSD